MTAIDEQRFVLPPDVVVVPVATLAAPLRRQIEHGDGDYAVGRARQRRPSKVLDAGSAALLNEFRTPSTIAEAVLRYSRARQLDACQTLDSAFAALQSLVAGELLVPAEQVAESETGALPGLGTVVDGFAIVRLVQALDDSALFEAVDAAGGRAALKMLPASAGDAARAMLEREADVLARLGGVDTPPVLGRGEWNGCAYIAVGWLAGIQVASAAARLRQAGPAAQRRLQRLCASLLAAFARIHERGVLHGDIHPGNLLASADDRVMVLDFGRAEWLGVEGSVRRAGIGYYYEPELASALARGQLPPPATAAGEQYALAALVYQLMTGQFYVDFSLETERLLEQVATLAPLPFAQRGQRSWPALERVLGRALAKDPAARYPSVAEFAAAFAAPRPPRAAPANVEPFADAFLSTLGFEQPLFASGLQRPPRASLAHGSAGLAYLLLRSALARDDGRLLALADAWAQRSDARAEEAFTAPNQGLTPRESGPGSVLHGRAGPAYVQALIADARQDGRAWAAALADFVEAAASPSEHNDLAFGRAGALLAGAELLEARDAGEGLRAWMRATLDQLQGPERPLGMAHGGAGTLYATLRACQSLRLPVPGPTAQALERLATVRPDTAGWCRGSAGLVHLWALADHLMPGRPYRRWGEAAALDTHRHSERNPGLCCGLAGRALALLAWYRHTGERVWLRRARRLAGEAERACAFSDNPYSLFQGVAGVALLAVELEQPEQARMPLFA